LRTGTSHPFVRVMWFVVDDHLGRLARLLRTLAYDTLWVRSGRDAEIVAASADGRVFLTRDRGWSERTLPGPIVVVRDSDPILQLREVVTALGLEPGHGALLTRCTICNAETRPVEKADVESRLPPYVRKTQSQFRICPGCNRIYWEGTHAAAIRRRLTEAGLS